MQNVQYRKGNATVWVIIVIIILALGWWFFAGRDDTANTDVATTTDTTATNTDAVSLEDDIIEEIIITYGAGGFSPGTITINKGQTVRWVNQSSGDMWVASAMHPTHAVYPGSDIKKCGTSAVIFDQCENGDVFEFTFNEVGEWGYHNHSRASHFGKVIVR